MPNFDNKVVLVTGGASGIGRATALAFATEGADVVVTDVQTEAGEETVRMVGATRGNGTFVACDISKSSEVAGAVNCCVENYGRLDYAINNAGILGTMALTADCTEDNWDKITNVNLKGTWLCMKHELVQMMKQGEGVIVNIASNAGMRGVPELPAYSASKGGVVVLTRTAALEYAEYGIRINAINPGLIETEMVKSQMKDNPEAVDMFIAEEPIGRMGQPEEIAAAAVWLCSDSASFVTGHLMNVDGGLLA
jgi:NAD(P)-dependent dehydrogenase (short-subunit alcohol dehydrogenase family)